MKRFIKRALAINELEGFRAFYVLEMARKLLIINAEKMKRFTRIIEKFSNIFVVPMEPTVQGGPWNPHG